MFPRKNLSRKAAILGSFILLLELPLIISHIKNRGLFFSLEVVIFFSLLLLSFYLFYVFRRKLSFEKKENETIFEVLNEGVVIFNKKSNITYINDRGAAIVGASKKDILLEKDSSLLWDQCRLLVKTCLSTRSELRETLSVSDHALSHIDVIIKPISITRGAVLIMQDASNQYKVRDMGRDFVANASHELRTPITIIKGFAETLQDLPQISDVMLEDIIEKILRNCKRMDNLVKNLLTLADLDSLPKTRMQECDLVALVDSCNYTLLSLHPHLSIEILHNKEYILILGDPDLLELAIMNVLENAVKYSGKNPHITVTVEERASDVLLSIQDRGMGINEEELQSIFDRFYTVNKARTRKLGGAGLGLSIVQKIIALHHGKIFVDSTLNEGTVFKFEFLKS